MLLVRYQGRIVQVAAAQLIEADDERRVKGRGTVQHFEGLGRVEGEGVLAGQLLGVGVAGQEALGERDHLHSFALGLFHPADHLGKVPLEVAAPGFELAMTDSHAPPPGSVPRPAARRVGRRQPRF